MEERIANLHEPPHYAQKPDHANLTHRHRLVASKCVSEKAYTTTKELLLSTHPHSKENIMTLSSATRHKTKKRKTPPRKTKRPQPPRLFGSFLFCLDLILRGGYGSCVRTEARWRL